MLYTGLYPARPPATIPQKNPSSNNLFSIQGSEHPVLRVTNKAHFPKPLCNQHYVFSSIAKAKWVPWSHTEKMPHDFSVPLAPA